MAESDASTIKNKSASGTGCSKEEMELNSFLTTSKEDNASSVNTIWAFFFYCAFNKTVRGSKQFVRTVRYELSIKITIPRYLRN